MRPGCCRWMVNSSLSSIQRSSLLLDLFRRSPHHPLRRANRRSYCAIEKTVAPGRIDAGTLLEHRLLEVTGGYSHFLAERQHLFRSQPFADVALPGLQLSGTLHDPLECRAVDLPDWRVGHVGGEISRRACRPFGRPPPAASQSCRPAPWPAWRLLPTEVRRLSEAAAARLPRQPDLRPPAMWRKGRNISIGMGKSVVELFSAAISTTVWR